eukprot:IDg15266t1
MGQASAATADTPRCLSFPGRLCTHRPEERLSCNFHTVPEQPAVLADWTTNIKTIPSRMKARRFKACALCLTPMVHACNYYSGTAASAADRVAGDTVISWACRTCRRSCTGKTGPCRPKVAVARDARRLPSVTIGLALKTHADLRRLAQMREACRRPVEAGVRRKAACTRARGAVSIGVSMRKTNCHSRVPIAAIRSGCLRLRLRLRPAPPHPKLAKCENIVYTKRSTAGSSGMRHFERSVRCSAGRCGRSKAAVEGGGRRR